MRCSGRAERIGLEGRGQRTKSPPGRAQTTGSPVEGSATELARCFLRLANLLKLRARPPSPI